MLSCCAVLSLAPSALRGQEQAKTTKPADLPSAVQDSPQKDSQADTKETKETKELGKPAGSDSAVQGPSPAPTATPTASEEEKKPEEEDNKFGSNWVPPANKNTEELDRKCRLFGQQIVTLREPQFGGAVVWAKTYEESGMDVFSDVLPLSGGHVLAAGSFSADKKDADEYPLLVRYDDRMRVVFQVRDKTSDPHSIIKVVWAGEGDDTAAVFGNTTNKAGDQGVFVSFYDPKGKKIREQTFLDAGQKLFARGFVARAKNDGYLAVIQSVSVDDPQNQRGVVYKLSSSGDLVWKRSYQTGYSTVFQGITSSKEGEYILSGQIVTDKDLARAAGWILRIDEDGNILSQKTYPRGASAAFLSVARAKDGSLFSVGKSRPLGGGEKTKTGAWVMKMTADGTPIWQRFYVGDYDYEARDLILYDDGRVAVLLNAGAMKTDKLRSHARIMTFTPLGSIEQLDDFTEGQHARALRMVAGPNGTRILSGFAQGGFGDDQAAGEAAPTYTYDGWLLSAPALDPYHNPCSAPSKENPIFGGEEEWVQPQEEK